MAAASKRAKKAPAKSVVVSDPFSAYFSVGESIATLFHPYAEVVLHDLRTGRIVRIWNSFTERQAGDLSNLKGAQDLFPDHQSILGPYEKALPSQGRTKSITAGLRGSDGELIGFLCTNLDVTLMDQAVAMLSAFASPELKRPEPIYRTDLQQHISYLVRDFSLRVNKPIDNLTRQERAELVAIVDKDGLFQARNSVTHVAKAMKISRASVYNLLAEVNRPNDQSATNSTSSAEPTRSAPSRSRKVVAKAANAELPAPVRRRRAG
jgi:predicted transcriptional regulator YheO